MANVQPLSSSLYLSQKQQERKVGSSLGKDDFLKILMAQLQNQDPTNPMKDNEFIAQMAQFSALEQMSNMTKAFESYTQGQQQSMLIQYNQFVGKEVKWHEITEQVGEDGKPIVNEGTGLIVAIRFVDGSVQFKLEDGKILNPGNISEVIYSGATSESGVTGGTSTGSYSSNSLVEASMLIGKAVSYSKEGNDMTSKVVSVTNKSGTIEYLLENGDKLTSDQFSTISQ